MGVIETVVTFVDLCLLFWCVWQCAVQVAYGEAPWRRRKEEE